MSERLWSKETVIQWDIAHTVGPCPPREVYERNFLLPEDKAKQLGVTVEQLAQWRAEGTGPAYLDMADEFAPCRYFDERGQ